MFEIICSFIHHHWIGILISLPIIFPNILSLISLLLLTLIILKNKIDIPSNAIRLIHQYKLFDANPNLCSISRMTIIRGMWKDYWDFIDPRSNDVRRGVVDSLFNPLEAPEQIKSFSGDGVEMYEGDNVFWTFNLIPIFINYKKIPNYEWNQAIKDLYEGKKDATNQFNRLIAGYTYSKAINQFWTMAGYGFIALGFWEFFK